MSVTKTISIAALLVALSGISIWFVTLDKLDVAGFSRARILSTTDVNDLGLADINNDGFPDLFTTNHSSREHALLNQGDGSFSGNSMAELGLSQSARYPGLEASGDTPDRDEPGLYIYFWYGALVLEAYGLSGSDTLKGSLVAPWKLEADVSAYGENTLDLADAVLPGDRKGTRLEFQFAGDGALLVHSQPKVTLGIPYRIQLSPEGRNVPVFVGTNKVEEKGDDMLLQLKDRHGMAFADVNDDGHTDVFVSRGGMRGMVGQVAPESMDELFLWTGYRFADETARRNILKEGCPGRGTSWADYDGDGDLDLYEVCGRTQEPSRYFPNRLYRRGEDGNYTEVAVKLGLDFEPAGVHAWTDWNADGKSDLLWVTKGAVSLWENRGETFARAGEAELKGIHGVVTRLALGDYDNDGDIDVFITDRKTAYLVNNAAGGLSVIAPATLGLPAKANTAAWVDYDRDGRMDLHTLPGGIYLQDAGGRFRGTGDFALGRLDVARDGRISWADLNGDGALDLVLAMRRVTVWQKVKRRLGQPVDVDEWEVYRYLSQREAGNWLGVSLKGLPGNATAIGARVTIKAGERELTQQVGQFEGSHYSQGNYTISFGLGPVTQVDSVTVDWPGGSSKTLTDVMANQVLEIAQQGG